MSWMAKSISRSSTLASLAKGRRVVERAWTAWQTIGVPNKKSALSPGDFKRAPCRTVLIELGCFEARGVHAGDARYVQCRNHKEHFVHVGDCRNVPRVNVAACFKSALWIGEPGGSSIPNVGSLPRLLLMHLG